MAVEHRRPGTKREICINEYIPEIYKYDRPGHVNTETYCNMAALGMTSPHVHDSVLRTYMGSQRVAEGGVKFTQNRLYMKFCKSLGLQWSGFIKMHQTFKSSTGIESGLSG
jgi:hypothetical protein